MNRQEKSSLEANFGRLAANSYPGRGIVMGIDETGNYVVQVYWIMGRSENSRNRVFKLEDGVVCTAPADPAKVKDPSLIIYNAMRQVDDANVDDNNGHVVSNGSQTDKVAGLLSVLEYADLTRTLNGCKCEPDAPNFTPRITALYRNRSGMLVFEFVVIRGVPGDDEARDVSAFTYEWLDVADGELGVGRCITTYQGDGGPLLSFRGEPIMLPLKGDIDAVAGAYWNALDPENRIAIVVKFIPLKRGRPFFRIINKYQERS